MKVETRAGVEIEQGGQLTLLPEVLQSLDWPVGTALEVAQAGGKVILRPRSDGACPSPFADDGTLSTRQWLLKHAGAARTRMTTDEFMYLTRGDTSTGL